MRIRLSLSAVALLVGVLVAGSAWARPCAQAAPQPNQALSSAAAVPAGLEQVFAAPEAVADPSVSTPDLKVGGGIPSWCTSRTNSYCTYNGWNWMTRCCYATYISPGAYCPTICE